jgi:hypothetical protein
LNKTKGCLIANFATVPKPCIPECDAVPEVDWLTHTPAGKDGTRTTARSKGKVERPFRTVKEAHETLYHFHKPETELQANEWLWNYLSRYNAQQHRSEKHSRLEDWLANIIDGVRDMQLGTIRSVRPGAGIPQGGC